MHRRLCKFTCKRGVGNAGGVTTKDVASSCIKMGPFCAVFSLSVAMLFVLFSLGVVSM